MTAHLLTYTKQQQLVVAGSQQSGINHTSTGFQATLFTDHVYTFWGLHGFKSCTVLSHTVTQVTIIAVGR